MGGYSQLPIVQFNPNSGIEGMQKVVALKSLLQEGQLRGLEIQKQQQAQKDDQNLRRAFADSGGDWEKAYKLANQYGVSPLAVQTLQQHRMQMEAEAATKTKTQLANLDDQHYNFGRLIEPLTSVVSKQEPKSNYPESPDLEGQGLTQQSDSLLPKKQQLWTGMLAEMQKNPAMYTDDPQKLAHLPQDYQQLGDEGLQSLKALNTASHKAVQEANEKASHMTPEKIAMQGYIDQGMSQNEAYQQILADKENAKPEKPEPAAAAKQAFQASMTKLAGEFDGALMAANTSPNKLGFLINKSKTLSQQEKSAALGYMMANPTPASQALSVTLRGESFASSRPVQVIDTKNGNRPVTMNLADMEAGNRVEPGRYLSQAGGMQAVGQKNLMEDIRGAITNTRSALTNQQMPDFPPAMRAKMLFALKQNDPHSAFQQFASSEAINEMTPEQQDFVVAINQLTENAMAMRTILKAGQGSEDMRSAIKSTLPGILSPNKEFAKKQLDAFEQQVNRLSRGIPDVPLNEHKVAGGGAGAQGEMITVQLPGHPPGQIPASAKKKFLQDHPDATDAQGNKLR